MSRYPQDDETARWFRDHRATFWDAPTVKTLAWKKPDSQNCAIWYVIQGGTLMVWGDLESAVYRWSGEISWKFLAGCGLDYFESKCEASPKGRDYEDYDNRRAVADFEEWLTREAEESEKVPDAELVADARRVLHYSEDEWRAWLVENGYDLFGGSWYEFAPLFGKAIAMTCAAHLGGIRMAVAQRNAEAVAPVVDLELAVD